MAFDLSTLKTEIIAAFNAANSNTDPAQKATIITQLGNDLGDAIDKFAKTGNATGTDTPTGDSHNLTLS